MKHTWTYIASGLNPDQVTPFFTGWPRLASVSFLYQRRLARRCGVPPTEDVKSREPDQVDDVPLRCKKSHGLRRKARACLKFLEREFGECRLKRARALPSRIECGYLRSAIRSCFDDLDEVQELSIKTSQKLEKSFCPTCESTLVDLENKWKKERFHESEVELDHLSVFSTQFGRNVDWGWNRGKYPYIPNGHACLERCRADGGTWRAGTGLTESFSVMPVVSAGKPRIVTLYGETNTSVLHPLHHSLYDTLRRKGWLLVGDPTDELVASLNGCGHYISADYKSATDNIKTAYVRAAIEVLIDKGDGLSEQEVAALRMLGRLTIDGRLADRGQPMGSMMSFPVLCLINKTVVDLALNELLIEGKVSFKEWTGHRCLINGDDLLLREPSQDGGLLPRIVRHGSLVGLVVNREKTMVDAEKGEINSTLFLNGVRQKKVNCGALFMGRDEADVIGYAARSSLTISGFVFLVERQSRLLALQDVKFKTPISCKQFNALLRSEKVRDALRSVPSEGQPTTNPFPVVSMPIGYDLSREEEIVLIRERVDRLRSEGYVPPRTPRLEKIVESQVSVRRGIKRKTPAQEESILRVLACGWKKKKWQEMVKEEPLVDRVPLEHVCDLCNEGSRIQQMICEIRELKRTTWLPARACQVPGTDPRGWAL